MMLFQYICTCFVFLFLKIGDKNLQVSYAISFELFRLCIKIWKITRNEAFAWTDDTYKTNILIGMAKCIITLYMQAKH